jgi:hypothetical protein
MMTTRIPPVAAIAQTIGFPADSTAGARAARAVGRGADRDVPALGVCRVGAAGARQAVQYGWLSRVWAFPFAKSSSRRLFPQAVQ